MAVSPTVGMRKSKWILVMIVFCVHSAATSSVWDCTFEEDLCDWANLLGAPSKWLRNQTLKGNTSAGPVYDHTYGNGSGWYAQSPRKGRATLQSRTSFKANQTYCFSFWILASRAYNQSLEIKAGDQQFFLNIDYQGEVWRSVFFELPKLDNSFKVHFATPQSSNIKTDIALDDIVVTEGNCSKVGNSGFQEGLGLYYNDVSNDFSWITSRHSDGIFQWLPEKDITQQSTRGSFAVAATSKDSRGKRATLWSPVLKSDIPFCTIFYLKIHGTDPGTIAVDLVSYADNSNITALSYTPPAQTEDWYGVVRFPVLASDSYQIKITVTMGTDGGWAFDGMETYPKFNICTVKPLGATGRITVSPPTTPSTITTSKVKPTAATGMTTLLRTTPSTITRSTFKPTAAKGMTTLLRTTPSTITKSTVKPTAATGMTTLLRTTPSTITKSTVNPTTATGKTTLLRTTPSTSTTSTGSPAPDGRKDANKSPDSHSAGWTVPVAASAGALAVLVGVVVVVVVYRRRRGPARGTDSNDPDAEYSTAITANPIYGQVPTNDTVIDSRKGSDPYDFGCGSSITSNPTYGQVPTNDTGPTAFENPIFPGPEEEESDQDEITLPINIPTRDHSII